MVSSKFKNIAIYSSINNEKVVQISHQLEEIISSLNLTKVISRTSSLGKSSSKSYSDSYINKRCDLVVAIGGDGTLLSAARKFGSNGLPILGINLGSLGFLTDIVPDELTTSFRKVLLGEYIEDERYFLQAHVKDSRSKNLALNEVVIHSSSVAQLMEYELYINKMFVYRQKADGIIISSPTGSTAYSLSGNGPIIHPEVKTITLLPMFAHSLNARPLIVSDTVNIEIKVCSSGGTVMSLDSHTKMNLKQNSLVKINKNDGALLLIHPNDHDFYSACRNKLGWSLGNPGNNS